MPAQVNLTIRVHREAAYRARVYAAMKSTSVSQVVQTYFESLPVPDAWSDSAQQALRLLPAPRSRAGDERDGEE